MASGPLPPLLAQVAEMLEAARDWAPDDRTVIEAERMLVRGPQPAAPAAPLSVVAPQMDRLAWVRLREAATQPDPRLMANRTGAAWSALAAAGQPVALVIGADDHGKGGVALGLPGEDAVHQWLSDQAPDLIWEPGQPPGWSVLADPAHLEEVLTCRPTAVEPRAGDAEQARLPTLTRLLAIPRADWCAVLVLVPLPKDVLSAAGDRLGLLRAQAARRVARSENISDHASRSVTDPRAESVAACLTAWNAVVDDCLQAGGWSVGAHVCARTPQALAVTAAAFSWSLSAEASAAPERRAQNWDAGACAIGASPVYGWLSSKDLGALLVPPDEALGDLQVRRRLPAGRRSGVPRRPVVLGSWLGTTLPAILDVDDMAGHVFVAGITGSGKSTTTSSVLVQLWNEHEVPFLVIDPAKTDYQQVSRAVRGGLTVVRGTDLRMNVLKAWPGRPAGRHIALVSTAFRAAFGMPVPVPYVASLLLEQLAADAAAGCEVTLHDAAAQLDALVAELGYQGEIEDNIRASLGLRLRLLLQPGRAERVASTSAPTWLTQRPTLVQLSDLGDEEEQAFLAGLLVLYIADAARARGESSAVQHVTVIEEAHRLMPEPRPVASEQGDAASVAARLMTQLLAEVRAYGESVVVVDQSPAAVAREVLRNTTLKLTHRIVDTADQKSLGGALGLGEDEVAMLGSLTVGRCLMSSRDLVRPQSVQVTAPDLTSGAGASLAVPSARPARCHRADDAVHHHVSQAHGHRAELAVALWATETGMLDVVDLVRPILTEDIRARAACLTSIGIRRHVVTLRRIGQLTDGHAPGHEEALWSTVLGELPRPAHPGAARGGPYVGCALCPIPCRARAVVASGALRPMQRARAAMGRAASAKQAVDAALTVAESCTVELAGKVSERTATGIGHCVSVHLAAEFGYDSALMNRMTEESTLGSTAGLMASGA